jgi:hypothetical protein
MRTFERTNRKKNANAKCKISLNERMKNKRKKEYF